MSDLNIDKLSIEIEANSNNASQNIDNLSSSLNKLKNATTGIKLTPVSNQLNKLTVATKSLNNAKFSNLTKNIALLGNAFSGLKNINGIDKSVISSINSLNKINNISNSLKGDKLVIFTTQMKSLAKAIEPLTELGKSNLGGALNQLKKLPETVKTLEKVNMSQFTTQMKSLAKAIEPLTKQSQRMSTVFSRLPLLVKSAGNQFNSFSSKLGKVDKSTRTLSSSLGAIRSRFLSIQFVGSMLTGAFTSVFEESSAYIENLNLFNVAMGSATNSAMKFAQSVQDAMGVDMSEWLRYQGAFNMMITGFGTSSDKAQIMSQNLTQLAYDYSSLMNVDVSATFDKLNSAMSGQIKGLKEFGNNVSVAMVKQTGLKYGLSGAVASWDQNTQAIMRYVTIMNNASKVDVFNDMARTIATPANAVRILTQQFTMLKRAIGNIASVFATYVIPYIQIAVQLLTQLANWFAKLVGFKLPEIDYSGIAGGGAGLDDVEDSANNVGDAVGGATDKVKELKKQLMGFDELNIINKTNEDSTGGAGGAGGVGGGGSIGDIELPQYDFLQGLENKTTEMLDRLAKKLSDMFKPFSDSWDKYGNIVLRSFKFQWEEIGKLTSEIGKSFNNVWQNGTGEKTVSHILGIITDMNISVGYLAINFSEAWKYADTGTKIIQNLWDSLNIVLEGVEEITSSFANWSKSIDFKTLLKSIEKITDAFKKFTDVIMGNVFSVYKEVLEPLSTWTIEKALPSLINSLAGAMKGLSNILKGLKPFISVLNKVSTELIKIGGNVILTGIKTVSKIIEGLGNICKKFSPLISGLATSVTVFVTAWKISQLLQVSTTISSMTTVFGTLKTVMISIKNLGFATAISGWIQQIGGGTSIVASMAQTFMSWNTAIASTTAMQGLSSVATKLLTIDLTAYGVAGTIATGITTALGTAINFLAANPLVAIGLAIAGVVTAFSLFSDSSEKATSDSNEYVKALRDECKQIEETTKKMRDAHKETKNRVNGYKDESLALKGSVERLRELSGEDGYVKNVEQAKVLIERINTQLPNTVKLTDDGRIAWLKTNDEIAKNIELVRTKAQLEAYYDDYVNALGIEKQLRSEMNSALVAYNDTQSKLAVNAERYNAMIAKENELKANGQAVSLEDIKLKNDLLQKHFELNSVLTEQSNVLQASTEAYNVNGTAISDYELKQQSIGGTVHDTVISMVADYTEMGEKGTSTWESLVAGINDTTVTMEGHVDATGKAFDVEGQKYIDSCKIMRNEMINKAGVFGNSYDSMIKYLDSKGYVLSENEKKLLKKQYDTWYLNSEEIKKLHENKLDVLQFQNAISLSDMSEDTKTKLATITREFAKTGDANGIEMLSNLATALDKNGYKSDKEIEDIITSAETKCKESNPEMTTKVSKPSSDALGKVKSDISRELGTIQVPIKLKASNTGIKVGGETFKVTTYATGGMPAMGEMFVAREAGPELVGRIGKKSAVANNDQIIGGISSGVYDAVRSAMGSSGGNGGKLVVHAHVEIDKREIGKASVEYNNGIVKQTGKSPLLV